ncbi:pyocin activator protein PrtN [Alteromonas portus]|uniref:Pyocin activator protein PrtN n=1 Tax=Alteromonas portus TaxID=2565549 RepID=A0A4U0Z505_9ALTE|nr:pyocin activator PrtN family protein [Alteromonas portus]TKB00719.1 pyocin activator protein PrtN [Alteromonas portus]
MNKNNYNTLTLHLLLGTYGGRVLIPLEEICYEIFGLSLNTAKRQAKKELLPVPCIKSGSSQKSPLMVSIYDLANYMDKSRAIAYNEWRKARTF